MELSLDSICLQENGRVHVSALRIIPIDPGPELLLILCLNDVFGESVFPESNPPASV
jgi:hypothetical protein